MSELEARFRVSLTGKEELGNFLRDGARDVKSFSSTFKSAFKDAGKEIAGFGLATAKSLASMASGNIGIAQTAKNVLEFRDSLSDLAVQANISDDKLGGLRDQIHSVAKASNQMQGDITEALGAFVAKTGDIETARRNLELYAKTATATGASLKDVALIGVELSDKLGIKDQRNALGILAAQGRSGAVEIRDLATKAPKIFSAAASAFGVQGEEGLRGTGALAQVFAKGFGGSGSAASVSTSIENVFTDILKAQSGIERAGIKVQGRDPYEVIKDLIRKTHGDPRQLLKAHGSGIFDIRAMRGINVMAREYRETGGFGTFDAFKNIQGADLDSDVKRRMSTGQAQLTASQISIAASADKNLGDSFDKLAHHADLVSGAFEMVTSHPFLAGGAAAAGLVAKNMVAGMLSGKGGGGIARMLGAGGVQHVWVDNPGFGGPGGAGGPAGGGRLAAAMQVAAVGVAAYEGASALDEATGGHVSGGASKLLYRAGGTASANQELEDIKVDSHRLKLARLKSERDIRIMDYESKGYSHGQAVFQADQAVKNLTVIINGDTATAQADSGTRSPEVMVKRAAGGPMSTWADILQEGSFDGVGFDFVSTHDNDSNDLDIQKFEGRPGQRIEGREVNGRRIEITGVFIEDDYPDTMNKLLAKLRNGGVPKEFVHPVFGSIQASCASATTIHDIEDAADSAMVQIVLEEHTEGLALTSATNTAPAHANALRSALTDALVALSAFQAATEIQNSDVGLAIVGAINLSQSLADNFEATGDQLSALELQAQANGALAQLSGPIDTLANYETTEQFELSESLLAVAAEIRSFTKDLIEAKPPLTDFIVPADTNILSWTHDHYGSSDRADEVLSLNAFPDPSLLPAGTKVTAYAA